MRLDFALLCTSAEYLADGRMLIVGAGIDGVFGTQVPFLAQLWLVARAQLMPEEPVEGHTFRVEATKPDGERAVLAQNESLQAGRNEQHPEWQASCNLFINLQIMFSSEGGYRLHLFIDDVEVKTIHLHVAIRAAEGGENE